LRARESRVPTASRPPVVSYRIPPLDEVFASESPLPTNAPPRSRPPQSPGPSRKKRRRARFSRRPVYKRRRRIALLIFVLLLVTLALGGKGAAYLLSDPFGGTSGDAPMWVVTPTIGQAPEPIAEETAAVEEEEKAEGEEVSEEEEEEAGRSAAVAPEDPTLYLTVPRLGMYGHTVRNENSEFALGLGAIKLPDTPFPWEKGDKNTYIACHRLGFPGTESFNQCLNLPSVQKEDEIFLTDTGGRVYEYRVSELLNITPDDKWVMDPVEGRDMISLQTCLEVPGDFVTLGPNWEGRLIVRADRVG
jgi:sortase A